MKLRSIRSKAMFTFCLLTPAFYILSLLSVGNRLRDSTGYCHELENQRNKDKKQRTIVLPTHSPPDDAIYFIETQGRSTLGPKLLCSIEAACRHHPFKRVIVAMSSSTLVESKFIERLKEVVNNLDFVHFDLEEWFIVKGFDFAKGRRLFSALSRSRHRASHASDFLRCIFLFLHGGIYLDLDSLVIQNIGGLRNALGLMAPSYVNGAVLAFEKGHPFLEDCLNEFLERYDGKKWAANGPMLLTRVLQRRWCMSEVIDPNINCSGVTVLGQDAFYPIPHGEHWLFFQDGRQKTLDKVTAALKNSYVAHFWNKLSSDHLVRWTSETQPFAVLARKHCPLVSRHAAETQSNG